MAASVVDSSGNQSCPCVHGCVHVVFHFFANLKQYIKVVFVFLSFELQKAQTPVLKHKGNQTSDLFCFVYFVQIYFMLNMYILNLKIIKGTAPHKSKLFRSEFVFIF